MIVFLSDSLDGIPSRHLVLSVEGLYFGPHLFPTLDHFSVIAAELALKLVKTGTLFVRQLEPGSDAVDTALVQYPIAQPDPSESPRLTAASPSGTSLRQRRPGKSQGQH